MTQDWRKVCWRCYLQFGERYEGRNHVRWNEESPIPDERCPRCERGIWGGLRKWTLDILTERGAGRSFHPFTEAEKRATRRLEMDLGPDDTNEPRKQTEELVFMLRRQLSQASTELLDCERDGLDCGHINVRMFELSTRISSLISRCPHIYVAGPNSGMGVCIVCGNELMFES